MGGLFWDVYRNKLSPCGQLDITDTSLLRTGTESPAVNAADVTETNSRYYGLSLL